MKKKSEIFFRNLIGLIFIGISDSFAAIIGKKFGNKKIVGQKTLAGSSAYFFSGIVSFWIFGNLEFFDPKIFLVCLFGTLVELFSSQNDNLIVPILALEWF